MKNFKAFLSIALYILLQINFVFSQEVEKNSTDSSTVILAIVVFRHGERSPGALYPNDPHRNYSWAGGYGALTPRGALQAYNLGLKLRKRYKLLLPSNGIYSKDEIYVRSSSKERCLMTAQSFLAGFLPPTNELHQLPIQWQPIPISSYPPKLDRLVSQRAYCPKYDQMLDEFFKNPSDDMELFIRNNTELFEYISKHTGKKLTSIHRGEQLYDILLIEKNNGLTLPDWTEKVYPDKLLALAQRTFAVYTENNFMKRVKGGYLITDVLDKMVLKRAKELNPDRKIFIYSGHDLTILAAVRALDITFQTTNKPDFTATLYFELHKNPNLKDDLEVKILYSSNAESEIKQIKIPNCEPPCSLTKFSKAVEHIIFRDYDETCEIEIEKKSELKSPP